MTVMIADFAVHVILPIAVLVPVVTLIYMSVWYQEPPTEKRPSKRSKFDRWNDSLNNSDDYWERSLQQSKDEERVRETRYRDYEEQRKSEAEQERRNQYRTDNSMNY